MKRHEFSSDGASSERRVGSFLVRLWREPSGDVDERGPLRCFVRDLKTGREEYLGELDELISRLTASLDESTHAPRTSETFKH